MAVGLVSVSYIDMDSLGLIRADDSGHIYFFLVFRNVLIIEEVKQAGWLLCRQFAFIFVLAAFRSCLQCTGNIYLAKKTPLQLEELEEKPDMLCYPSLLQLKFMICNFLYID